MCNWKVGFKGKVLVDVSSFAVHRGADIAIIVPTELDIQEGQPAPAPVRIPTAHIVASVEAAIGRAKPSEKLAAKARMNVIGAIHRAKIPPRNISHKEMRALKDIANDEKILVFSADKGKATVTMDKADYDDKMQQMLSDEGTYNPLDRDPTASLERRMNSRLLDLKKAGRLHPDA